MNKMIKKRNNEKEKIILEEISMFKDENQYIKNSRMLKS